MGTLVLSFAVPLESTERSQLSQSTWAACGGEYPDKNWGRRCGRKEGRLDAEEATTTLSKEGHW